MKILVLLAPVLDTEVKIKPDASKMAVDTTGIQQVINPWDEFALTRAIELKEQHPESVEKIVVATVGTQSVEPVMRKALAIGADEACRIDCEPSDAFFTATQLAQVARDFDLVFAGVEGSDYNNSSVGAMLAEMIGIESLGSVASLDIKDDNFVAGCDINGTLFTVTAPAPLLVVIQKGIADMVRIANMRGILSAKSKPLKVLEPVGCDVRTEVVATELPPMKEKCKMIAEDEAAELVRLLREEARVL